MAPAIADLRLVHAAVERLAELEGQDRALVIEMSQAMLADLIGGGLRPLTGYVGHYCDVLAEPGDADAITAEIEAQIDSEENG